jgi:GxxExxY protein
MKVLHRAESDKINELVREVWNTLGSGFTGDVYADALEREFLRNGVPYQRNPKVDIYYKGAVLPHTYRADFIVFGKIVLRITGSVKLDEEATRELISVLKATKNSLALHINWKNTMPFVTRVIVASKFINSTNIGTGDWGLGTGGNKSQKEREEGTEGRRDAISEIFPLPSVPSIPQEAV